MVVKSVLFRFIFLLPVMLLFTSCSDDQIILRNLEEDIMVADTSRTIIPFQTVSRWRSFTINYDLNTQFVLKSEKDRLDFLELPGSSHNISEQSILFWSDSMIVGIVYGKSMGLRAEFVIDSLIVDSIENRIESYSHIKDPLGDKLFSFQFFHFVKVRKFNQPLFIYQISDNTDPPPRDSVPFRTLFNERSPFRVETPKPFMVVLKNNNDKEDFLNTTSINCIGSGCFKFPDFAYGDSILVGVIGFGTSSSIAFSIISLMKKDNVIEVNAAYISFEGGRLSDITTPVHFVAIKHTDAEIALNDIIHFGARIE